MPPALLERARQALANVRMTEVWARPGRVGGNTAVYLVLHGGYQDDQLVEASTPWATRAELHQTVIDEAGIARMVRQQQLDIPASHQVRLAPGGRHIMLIGLVRELGPGQMFPLSLRFGRAGVVRVMVSVAGQPVPRYLRPPAK